jgi:hypothetical protein
MNIERVKNALTPDFNSQGAYTGRIIQRETFVIPDSEGNPIQVERDVVITWDTIKEILSLVRERAQLD